MPSRIKSLDILRALAVLLVLCRHIMRAYPTNNEFLSNFVHILRRSGWCGVDLFFVLSGFLISGLLFKEHLKYQTISFTRFFIRRGLKIYPLFYLMIFFTLALSYLPHCWIAEIFFMQDYFPSAWEHTWSLGVEEKFYLLLPLLFLAAPRICRSKNSDFGWIPVVSLIIGLSCLLLRLLTHFFDPHPANYLLTEVFPFHLRMDSLFCGVVISYYYHYHTSTFKKIAQKYKYLFLVLGITLFIPAFLLELNSPFILTFGFTLLYLGSGLVLIAVVDAPLKPGRWTAVLAYIGANSYAIYLWHMPVERLYVRYQGLLPQGWSNWYSYIFCYFVGSLALGIIMSRVIDQPILKWRDKILPRL